MRSILYIFLVVLFGLLGFLLFEAINVWAYPHYVETACPADMIVVMGAAQYNGRPSPAFKRRLDKALELYRQNCAPSILVTGGTGDGDVFSEGDVGVNYLADQGVPPQDLLSETQSRTSFENLLNSQTLIGDAQVLVVTDDMHSYRTHWLINHFELEGSVAPVETGGIRFRYGLREIAKLTAYQFGLIQ